MDRHLAFVSLPAYGHVNPTLPVVAELVRRGWRVSYATGDEFAPQVETAGATLVPTGGWLLGRPGSGPVGATAAARFFGWVVDDARATVPRLQEHFRTDPPRAVCFDAMALAGRVLAATTGAADVALVPAFASHERSSPFARSGRPPAEFLAAVAQMREVLTEFGVGAPPGPGMLPPASLNVVFLPPEFQPGAETFDARFRFVGPSPDARETDASWTAPVEPVLFVSLGTAFNDRPDFYRACLAAFDGAGPVAMAVGRRVRVDDLGPVPGNVDVRPWFPQPAVLRHARAFVSHAGMNSVMEALYYGVPLVCVPQMVEQELNAGRVAELGLGVRLAANGLTAADLHAAVDTVVTDAGMHSALDAMRAAIVRAGGAVAAADAIEAHLRG